MTRITVPLTLTHPSSLLCHFSLTAAQTFQTARRLFCYAEAHRSVAMFVPFSRANARAAEGLSLSMSEWLTLVGLIPAFLGVVLLVMDRIGRHGRYENAKTGLEIVKLKLEIEGIRKSQQLSLPEISVTPEELAALQHPVGAHFDLFAPESLRRSKWYRFIRNHPRRGPWVTRLTSAIIGFYGVSLFVAVFSIQFANEILSIGERILIGAVYFVIGFLLILLSVRIRRARKLALDELHPAG